MTMKKSEAIARAIGDTFIEFERMSPREQWERIVSLLENAGWIVTFAPEDVECDGSNPACCG